jgi:hypothetical protein
MMTSHDQQVISEEKVISGNGGWLWIFWVLPWWVLVSIAGFAQALSGLGASRSPSSQTAHLLLNDKMERIQQCLVIAL